MGSWGIVRGEDEIALVGNWREQVCLRGRENKTDRNLN